MESFGEKREIKELENLQCLSVLGKLQIHDGFLWSLRLGERSHPKIAPKSENLAFKLKKAYADRVFSDKF